MNLRALFINQMFIKKGGPRCWSGIHAIIFSLSLCDCEIDGNAAMEHASTDAFHPKLHRFPWEWLTELLVLLDRLYVCKQTPKSNLQFHTTPLPLDKKWQILSMELLLKSVDSSTRHVLQICVVSLTSFIRLIRWRFYKAGNISHFAFSAGLDWGFAWKLYLLPDFLDVDTMLNIFQKHLMWLN